jgi:hypothetical protein
VTRADRRCLLQRLAFSKLCHFSWDNFPTNTMAYDTVFNSVGALWTFAPQNPYSTNEHLSFVAQISNDFKQNNGHLKTQSMIFVITSWHSQLQISLSLTHKCYMRAIISIFLRLWKLNSMIMKDANTGHSCYAMTYLSS